MVSLERYLSFIHPELRDYAKPYLVHVEKLFEENGIQTPLQKAHFLTQITEESQWFKNTKQNFNYSKSALLSLFTKHFPTEELASEYARQPEKIANRIYALQLGNGDESSGDGWRYRGRGLIKIIGKANYRRYGQSRNIDCISYPERLIEPYYAIDSSIWYWQSLTLNSYADKNDLLTITKRINGDLNKLDQCLECLALYMEVFDM